MTFRTYIYFVFLVYFCLTSINVSKAAVITSENNNEGDSFASNTKQSFTCDESKKFAWCIPPDYDKYIGPWEYRHLTNSSLPWYYFFDFQIFDILEVDDKKQTITFDMYLKLKWFEPRLSVNTTSAIWNQTSIEIDEEDHITLPLDYMKYFWIPDSEIYWLELYRPQNILRGTASFRTNKRKLLRYIAHVNIILSCQMNFKKYPFDSQECPFRQGSFANPTDIVDCTSQFRHDDKKQRHLQYEVKVVELPPEDHAFYVSGRFWATCGFNVVLKRQRTQIFVQVYLTSTLLVIASWASFIIEPNVVPGRMGLLVTIFLVLINIFMSVKWDAPTSSGFLNAVDMFLVVCIGEVFVAFLEYTLVLYGFGHPTKATSPSIAPNQEDTNIQKGTRTTLDEAMQEPTNGWIKRFEKPPKEKERNSLDRMCLFLCPITFLTFIIIYCYMYNPTNLLWFKN